MKVRPAAPAVTHTIDNVQGNIGETGFPTNIQPPSYQKVDRPPGNAGTDAPGMVASHTTEGRICRICLDEDHPETMIAPCKCKGGSKWVHRDCLDEWRTNEKDRAFSKCTECLFEYYMQPVHDVTREDAEKERRRRRKIRFCLYVSRDIFFGTLLLQVVIATLGALIYAFDVNKSLPELLGFQDHPVSLYYLLGWLLLLVLTGLFGSVALCVNGCSISESLAQLGPPVGSAAAAAGTSHSSNVDFVEADMARGSTEYYRRARRRRQGYNQWHYQSNQYGRYNNHCCYYGFYDCHPICCADTCNACGNCCNCCCIEENRGQIHPNHDGCGDCCRGCTVGTGGGDGGGNGGGGSSDCGDGAHILLIILLIAAIVLALIGFLVGVVITVIAFQRVVQRHIHLVQKRQLVQEFQVMDLQDYDLDLPLATAPPEEEDIEVAGDIATPARVLPSAPVMPDKDATYLHRLGLLE